MTPGRLIAAGVCVLVLVAGIDALRGGDGERRATSVREPTTATSVPSAPGGGPPAIPGSGELTGMLRANGISGVLVVVDAHCVLRALALPTLGWLAGPAARPRRCTFAPSPAGSLDFPIPSADALTAAVRGQGRVPRDLRDLRVEQRASLGRSRVAVVASYTYFAGRDELVAVFEGGRLLVEPTVNDRFADLRVSPRRRLFTLQGRAPRGLFFFARDGRLVSHNPVAGATHAAWSPDERWTALATGASTYLLRTADLSRVRRGGRLPLIRLPFYAADLAWR